MLAIVIGGDVDSISEMNYCGYFMGEKNVLNGGQLGNSALSLVVVWTSTVTIPRAVCCPSLTSTVSKYCGLIS